MKKHIHCRDLMVHWLVCLVCVLSGINSHGGQPLSNWFTFSANLNGGYENTAFSESGHNAALVQWDSRAEIWLPPFNTNFSWGPYLRFAGIASTKNPTTSWFENAWLAAPGVGFQMYPFSFAQFRDPDSLVGKIFGPVRLFGEYNRQDYWGSANTWRPKEQIRAGMEYWRARSVNETSEPFWSEFWTGCYYQSANDFTSDYDTVVFANSLRVGARFPKRGTLSNISPYIVVDSSYTGHPTYYWENRFDVGAGIRFAPSSESFPEWTKLVELNRLVMFAEVVHRAYYYHSPASSVPNYEVQAGISCSLGPWYR
jgi:hypothetical protein